MEGQGLWETISSTESKGGPEYQRQGTEEGESDHQLFSLLSWFSKFGILFLKIIQGLLMELKKWSHFNLIIVNLFFGTLCTCDGKLNVNSFILVGYVCGKEGFGISIPCSHCDK